MKQKYFVTALFAAAAVLFSSCNNSKENIVPTDEGTAVLRINLQGTGLKASDTYATGTPAFENTIHNFTVYVFNAENNTLEDSQKFTSGTSGIISDLSTGFPKNIVVVANTPSDFPIFNQGDPYSDFMQAAAGVNLTIQSPANAAVNGLLMYGETANPVTLNPAGTTDVTIPIKRVAAKVVLGTINVIPSEDTDENEFAVTGVSIQRAVANTDVFGNNLSEAITYGGISGSWNSTVQAYLYDKFTAPVKWASNEVGQAKTFGNYFYVLPNASADSCTLLTVVSSYGSDQEQYFPIKINANMGDNNQTNNTDGTFIRSNVIYTINLTVNNLNEGTTDPDVPPTEGSINVKVNIEDWELITQKVIW